MFTAEAESAPAAAGFDASEVRFLESHGSRDEACAAESQTTDSPILGGHHTIRYAMAVAALAAAAWGGLDVVAVAICGHCIPWHLPLTIVVTYLSIGALAGAALGTVHMHLAHRKGAQTEPEQIFPEVRTGCLAGSVALVSIVLAERLDFDHAYEFGTQLRAGSIVLGGAVFLGAVVFLRRLLINRPAPRSYLWQAACVPALCLLWTPFNNLYNAPLLSGTSTLANGAYLLFAISLYFTGNFVLVRISHAKVADTPARHLRHALTVSILGLCIAWSIMWCNRRAPLDRAYAFAPYTAVPDGEANPNIVLIVMDTARADHLSCYGYGRQTTPHITTFAKEGLLYSQAVSTTSWTLPSHASLFTGLMPTEHGAHYHTTTTADGKYLRPLGDEHTTLAEILLANRYRTGAFVANAALLRRELGLSQGFLHYDDRPRVGLDTARTQTFTPAAWITALYQRHTGYTRVRLGYEFRDAADINTAALSWLDEDSSAPFFLFVNYMEPHRPYRPHPEFDARLDAVPACPDTDNPDEPGQASPPPLPSTVCNELATYDAELAYLDERIAALFEELKTRDAYDNSLIIVTSDHGEAFLEHGVVGHFNSLYEEEIHIPLIIRFPGGEIRGVETAPTSLAAVVPTVLAHLELGSPQAVVPSSSADVTPAMAELRLPDPILGGTHQVTMQALYSDDGFKAIRTAPPDARTDREESHELYDLARDPGEQNDLSRAYPVLTSQMSASLANWIGEARKRVPKQDEGLVMTAQLREQLRSLGYLD